jgi:pyruvate-formate lyase-activating enzyme
MGSKQDIDRLIDEIGMVQAGNRCRVAAILFTYRCSIACRHCCFCAAPGRPDVAMTARQCADGLRLLHETGRVIHIAGGEAMLYWETLSEAIRLAHEDGNAPHFIETNCSFAKDDRTARERLEFLAAHGVKGLLASADAFHQEFVPAGRFLRVRRIATEIFGERNFWGSRKSEAEIRDLESVTADPDRLREYVRSGPPSMLGSAHRELARFLDHYAPRDNRLPAWKWRGSREETDCGYQFRADTMWELHLDPYGNLQTNCGMILGKWPALTPAALFARGPETVNRFVRTVCEGGAVALAELARREHGFVLPERVTQTCELCYLTRSFLRRFHPDVFGPQEIYGQAR